MRQGWSQNQKHRKLKKPENNDTNHSLENSCPSYVSTWWIISKQGSLPFGPLKNQLRTTTPCSVCSQAGSRGATRHQGLLADLRPPQTPRRRKKKPPNQTPKFLEGEPPPQKIVKGEFKELFFLLFFLQQQHNKQKTKSRTTSKQNK